MLIIVPVIGVLLARAVDGDGRTDFQGEHKVLDAVPIDPQLEYETKARVSGLSYSYALGAPEQLIVTTYGDKPKLFVYDEAGEEKWAAEIDDLRNVLDLHANEVSEAAQGLYVVQGEGSELMTISRRDAESGEVVWTYESDYPGTSSVLALGDRMYLTDFETALTTLDLATGDETAEIKGDSLELALQGLRLAGRLLVVDGDSIVAYDPDLEPASEPIEVASTPSASIYGNGRVIVSVDGEIEIYDLDAERVGGGEFADVDSLYTVGGSLLLFESDDRCGVLDVANDEVEVLWEEDDCEFQHWGILDDGELYAVVLDDDNTRVLSVADGEERLSLDDENAVYLARNGVEVTNRSDGTIAAYELPGGNEAFSETASPGSSLLFIDGGFVALQEGEDEVAIAVYGDS